MTIERLPCGCAHDGRSWVRMCAPCKIAHDERHLRAQKEKDTAELIGRYTLGPTESGVVS